MKCKIEVNGSQQQAITGQKEETFKNPKSTKFLLPVTDLEENIKALSTQLVDTPYKKQIINFPKASVISDKAFYIGKKRFLLNETSFGPSDDLRAQGEMVAIDRPDEMDPFRLSTGFYWTTTSDNKGLIYLYGSPKLSVVKHQVLDFDYGDGLSDIGDIQQLSLDVGILEGEIEKIMASLGQPSSKKTTFSTQQWVLIQAVSSQFLIVPIDGTKSSEGVLGKTVMAVAQSPFAPGNLSDKNKQLASTSVPMGELVFSEKMWNSYVKGETANQGQQSLVPLVVVGRDYFDYSFSMDVPFLKDELRHYAAINRPMVADVGFEYNFFIKEYEAAIASVSENLLPNLYVLGLESRENDSKNNDYEDLVTLDGRIGRGDVSIVANRKNANIKDIKGDYFGKYAQAWRQISNGVNSEGRKQEKVDIRRLTELRGQFSNVAVSSSEVDILNSFERDKHLYPMYVSLDFSADRSTYLSSLLKKTQLEISLMRRLISKQDAYSKNFVEVSEIVAQQKMEDGSVSVGKSCESQVKNRRLWDISDWISNLAKQTKDSVSVEEKGILLEKGNSKQLKSIDSEVTAAISKLFFVGKVKSLIKDKFRSLEQLFKGKEAYSETVIYKVEKSFADVNGNAVGSPIQNYFITNVDELENIRLVDTQVKYGVRYRYDVFAYQLVIGTKYRYDSVVTHKDLASFLVTQVPMMVLAEVPYFSVSNQVLDNPPVFPDVEMVQYKGIENQILLWLTSNVGDYLQRPEIIESVDADAFQEFRTAKQIEGEELRFRSDDPAAIFQIYRTESLPSRYADFAGQLRASVQTDVSRLTPQTASAAAWVDTVRPGKKYWYCFRCIDVHGHMSNPTEVFQAELVNDAGFVYLDVKSYEMKDADFSFVRPFRKYIHIVPAYLQELVNEQKSGLSDASSVSDVKQIHLGLREKSVWGKRFKIRITSKNTGRKIDLNVDFRNAGVRVEEKR